MAPDGTAADIPIPALLRAARGAFAPSMREQLHEAGIDDLPRNGAYIVGGLTWGVHAGQLLHEVSTSDNVRSRLLQALLERGFVQPGNGEPKFGLDDLALTEKGRRAAEASARGITAVTQELKDALSPEQYSAFRAGLVALIDIKERAEERHLSEHEHSHDHPHEHHHEHG